MINVLYVDDEPALLTLGRTFLERSGSITVDTADSVDRALEMLATTPYDAIVSDFQMPMMDGIEFLRQVRSQRGQLPFILFTGRGREEVAIEALNNGADYYLQKGGEPKSQFAELEHNIRLAIERKRTRDELQESRQRMADLIEHLPDATFAVDLDGLVIVWNRTMEELTGMPAEKILGTGNYSYALPFYGSRRPLLLNHFLGHIEDLRAAYPNHEQVGNRLVSEGFFPKISGGKGAHLWFAASPLYDTKGNIIGAIQSIRDITDRKSAEQDLIKTHEELHAAYEQLAATEEELRQNYDELITMERNLRESEQRYKNVIEDQTEFICRFTPDGTHIFVNEAYCRYFGKKRGDVIGKKFSPEIPEEEGESLRSHFASLTRERPGATVTHRIIMPDGEIRWQQWSDRAIFNPDGTVREYQSVGRDVTDLKKTEAELLRRNEELNAAYEQLTATEEELRQNYGELTAMEQHLRESEQRYRNVIEDQTEFICRFNPDGTHIFVNEAYCRYFGKAREEIIGKKFRPNIPKDDEKRMAASLGSLTERSPVITITHRIIMPDGETRWQQWSDRAIFNPDGTIREYQSVGRDVTGLKKTEAELLRRNEELNAAYEQLSATEEELRQNYEELTAMERNLRESEQRYRNVIEDQTEFICRFLPDGTHIFVNEAYCRYFGKSREEITGEKFRPDIPEEDQERIRNFFNSLSLQNPVAATTHRIVMPDGEIRWQQWSDRAIFNPDGTVREYQSVGRDVTDLKNTEEQLLRRNEELNAAYEQLSATEEELRQNYHELTAMEGNLRESEQRYRNVIEDQTEFICRFTPDGTHIFVNEAYCRYFGKDREEILSRKFRPDIPEEDRKTMAAALAGLTEQNPVAAITHRIIMPDGETRWQQWSDRAIFNPDSTVREYQSVGRDVTGLKKAEEELLRKNEELNEMYEELTVTEEELRQNYDELITNQRILEKTERSNATLLGAIPDMMCILSQEGYYQDIHIPDDGDFYPYSRELVGKHIRDTGFERDVAQAILHRLDLALRTKQLQQFEYSVTLPEGERVYEARLMAINEKEALAIVHDITRRVATEMTLRENERKLNAIVQGSPIPLFVIDKDHRVIQWNRMLEEFTGIKSQDVVGTSGHQKVFYPGERPCLADLLVSGSAHNIPELYGGKYRKSQFFEDAYEAVDFFPNIPGKDGENGRWLYFSAAPIRDSEGTIIGAVETLEDITEARQNEEARKEALKKLNLLSRITRHDILNQLTVLSGYLAISKMQSDNPKILDYIRKEEIAAETIQRQIAFTRDYQNIGIHSPRWENPAHIINWVKNTLKPENVDISITFENVEIYADPLLEKVFYNLIENALRHGEKLTRITFSVRENRLGLTLICEDDGTGIPQGEKENIFNRKFFKNTGFGLFLSREILQITGLTIRETGVPGTGARFEIEVPKGTYRISR